MIKKLMIILAVLVVASIFLGGAYLLGEFQPKAPMAQAPKQYINTDQAAKELIEKSRALEDEYHKRVGINEATDEDIRIVEAAYASLVEYTKLVKHPAKVELSRMAVLKNIIDTFRSKELGLAIEEIEKEAKLASENGNMKKAVALYNKGIIMQAELNSKYPNSSFLSNVRIGSMSREIKLLESTPLYEKMLEAQALAKEAVEAKNWELAMQKYKEAISAQEKLNNDFRDSSHSSRIRLNNLKGEYESLLSAPAYENVQKLFAAYDSAMKSENFVEAAEALQDAIFAQEKLNKDFPNSKHSSNSSLQKWSILKEQTLSTKDALYLSRQIEELNKNLAEGNISPFLESIEAVLASTEKFRIDFPSSTIVSDNDLLKLRYLNFIKAKVEAIQKDIKGSLHHEIFEGKYLLMKCEVWQGLYADVMQNNPSGNKSSLKNPVESVSREDVENFCLRLSWILSADVDLPSSEIFKKAVGDMKYIKLKELAWYDNTSGKVTKEIMTARPNDIGFYDLLGNVAEYTSDNKIMGGSANSNSDALLYMGLTEAQDSRRSPFIGFRLILEK